MKRSIPLVNVSVELCIVAISCLTMSCKSLIGVGSFFFPSFISTSRDRSVATSGDFKKNALLIFDVDDGFGLTITPELSPLPGEQEVLLPCYTRLQYTTHWIDHTGCTIVRLKVLPKVPWCGVWKVMLNASAESVVIHVDGQQLVSTKLDGNGCVSAGMRHWEVPNAVNPAFGSIHHGRVKFRNPKGNSEWWFPDERPPHRKELGTIFTLCFKDINTIINHKGTVYSRVPQLPSS